MRVSDLEEKKTRSPIACRCGFPDYDRIGTNTDQAASTTGFMLMTTLS